MKVLLTGGAGYIGSHVALNLLDRGHEVTVIDNLSTGNEKLIPKNARFIKCNINNLNKIESIIQNENFDSLMHFAAFVKVEESMQFPEKYFENNTVNSDNLFKICIQNKIFNIVFSSTAAVYGNPINQENISENNKLNPVNPYGQSKADAEDHLIKQKNTDLNYCILRYFNVAGSDPKLRTGLISKNATHLIKLISEVATNKKKSITVFGDDYETLDGTAIRDYIHVSDLADIHVKALDFIKNSNKSEIFNCGYGKGYSVKQVIECANQITNGGINFKIGKRRSGDVEKLVSDVSKIKQMIDWSPKYNDLEFIIKSAIDWEKKLNGK